MRNKEELRLTFHPPMPILPLSKFGTSRMERSRDPSPFIPYMDRRIFEFGWLKLEIKSTPIPIKSKG